MVRASSSAAATLEEPADRKVVTSGKPSVLTTYRNIFAVA